MAQPPNPASGLSALLSLSQAAYIAQPIPMVTSNDSKSSLSPATRHRRLSSAGQIKRRLSDARDAVTRPSAASLHSAASALASLSLSSSAGSTFPSADPLELMAGDGTTVPIEIPVRRAASGALAKSMPTFADDNDIDVDIDVEDDKYTDDSKSRGGNGKAGGKHGGKKRGNIFRCECCSKVYRHPSCLIKHRWEHSPHWREASKFLLSKHQQVQLLEAAAILSHLSPEVSLPEDRSLWPSFLSGGALPPPVTAGQSATNDPSQDIGSESILSSSFPALQASSSVPITSPVTQSTGRRRGASTSGGPRLFDYKIPAGGGVGITQIRPGLLGHPNGLPSVGSISMTPYAGEPLSGDMTGRSTAIAVPIPTASSPMAVPRGRVFYDEDNGKLGASPSSSLAQSYLASSFAHSSVGTGGGWSLPRSDLRSSSVSHSESRSRSGSRSDDEESSDEVDGYVEDKAHSGGSFYSRNYVFSGRIRTTGLLKTEDDEASVNFSSSSDNAIQKIEEQNEEWDGMDMEMEF